MTESKDHYATPASSLLAISHQMEGLRARIKALFKSLPEAASDIRLLPGSVRCGVVSLSAIQNNRGILSPAYYLTIEAKESLEHIVDNSTIDTLDKKIQGILREGTIELPGRRTQPLNPEFLEALRLAWEGDPHATSIS